MVADRFCESRGASSRSSSGSSPTADMPRHGVINEAPEVGSRAMVSMRLFWLFDIRQSLTSQSWPHEPPTDRAPPYVRGEIRGVDRPPLPQISFRTDD